MNLPLEAYNFYVGIDPGFSGAIAMMNALGTSVRVWDMPVRNTGEADRTREIDLPGLKAIFRQFAGFPRVAVGIEWPTTRPDEGAERSERFGRQKGYLEAFAYLHRLDTFKIAPNLWKGRLGLDGKDIIGSNERAAKFFATFYPERSALIRGPRGGVLDGPMDALLICHFLRTRDGQGMRSIVDKFGKDSVEALAFILGGGRRKRKFGKRSTSI